MKAAAKKGSGSVTVPFVHRNFDCNGDIVEARFFQPKRATGGEFRCAFEIQWPNRLSKGDAPGEDSLQALALAMEAVRIELEASDAFKAGRLTLWNKSDLDLPTTSIYQQIVTPS